MFDVWSDSNSGLGSNCRNSDNLDDGILNVELTSHSFQVMIKGPQVQTNFLITTWLDLSGKGGDFFQSKRVEMRIKCFVI